MSVRLEAGRWSGFRQRNGEIDEPLPRFSTGAIDPDQWEKIDAVPTHRIFVDAEQFLKWMRGLQRPDETTEEQLEKIFDPSYVTPKQSASIVTGEVPSNGRNMFAGADAKAVTGATPPDVGPRLLSIAQVIDKVGVKKSTIYNRVKVKTFPEWLVIGGRSLWREDEIDQWIADQPRHD